MKPTVKPLSLNRFVALLLTTRSVIRPDTRNELQEEHEYRSPCAVQLVREHNAQDQRCQARYQEHQVHHSDDRK